MIRRQPTLILLNETDVQDAVKSFQEYQAERRETTELQDGAQPTSSGNPPQATTPKNEPRPLTREERLGL